MLYYIFLKVLFMSLAMTVGGVLILVSEKLFLHFFRRRLCRLLWLGVLILGLIPITGISRFSDKAPETAEAPAYVGDYSRQSVGMAAIQPVDNLQIPETAEPAADTEQKTDAQPKNNAVSDRGINYEQILSALYAVGLLSSAVFYIFRASRFRRALKHAARPCECELATECERITGTKGKIGFFAVNTDCSPFVYGIIRPKVFLPHGRISYESLLHELMHIKHRDTVFLLFANVVMVLHFFNPFVYLINKQLRKHMEFACDEETSALLDKNQRLEYSRNILSCAAPLSSSGACLSENGKNVKERIDIIMKAKKYTRLHSFAGVIITSVIIACMTICAAAINEQVPKQSYTAREVYGLSYDNGDKHWFSSWSDDFSQNRASLVNTAVYKSFSADVKAHFTDNLNTDAVTQQLDTNVHIEMDKFIGAIENGRTWQGLFTVTFDGQVILEEANGWLNNIPGEEGSDFARLYIESDDSNIRFDLYPINFSYTEDSKINAESEQWQLEHFDATHERSIFINADVSYEKNGTVTTDTRENYPTEIRVNTNTGQLYCLLPLVNSRYISSVPGETYTIDGNTASGTFFLNESGAIRLEEIEGTFYGFDSDTMSFISDDGSIRISMVYSSENEYTSWQYFQESDDPFINGFTSSQYRRRLSDLPFTLSLTEDKTHVRLSFKDDYAPDLYSYSYASYTGENSVYNSGTSDSGFDDVYLDISSSYGTHNLQFFSYYIYPHAKRSFYDISFKILNNELVYWGCTEYVDENTAYSGTDALDRMWDNGLIFWKWL